MVSGTRLDFSSFSQSTRLYGLSLFNRVLVKILRLLKLNNAAYKLDFYEKMLNFMRITALAALSRNIKYLPPGRPGSDPDDASCENRICSSLIEFLYHFGIVESRNNIMAVHPKYKGMFEKDIAGLIVKDRQAVRGVRLSKKDKILVRDFLFVKDLVRKYDDHGYIFQHIYRNRRKWGSLIKARELDYEVRLCETLINLADLNIPEKIKSPFKEDYYTESGQNAFRNFTGPAFREYLRKITRGNPGIRVFDLGCGYGNYIGAVHDVYPDARITGIELNPDVCAATSVKFRGIKNIEILNTDFFEYATDLKYDVILANYVLFYFNAEHKRKLFEKVKSMLAPEGSMIICQYFSGIEELKKNLARMQHDLSLSRKIEMYYSDKILYANTLWNDSVDTFSEAVHWNEFLALITGAGMHIESMTHADRFYYSLFIEVRNGAARE